MIAAAPPPWWKAMIRLAHTTGLRRAELWHLRWEDVDLEARTVRVQEHHAAGLVLAWKPKTKRSSRTLPLAAHAVAALKALHGAGDGSPYVFVGVRRLWQLHGWSKAGKLHPRYEVVANFTRDFGAIQAAAKVSPQGTFHDLRKTFATRAAAAGVPMHELQAHMGHSSITTTAGFYLGVEESAAGRLRAVFAEAV